MSYVLTGIETKDGKPVYVYEDNKSGRTIRTATPRKMSDHYTEDQFEEFKAAAIAARKLIAEAQESSNWPYELSEAK